MVTSINFIIIAIVIVIGVIIAPSSLSFQYCHLETIMFERILHQGLIILSALITDLHRVVWMQMLLFRCA